jgi:hypothetical protein
MTPFDVADQNVRKTLRDGLLAQGQPAVHVSPAADCRSHERRGNEPAAMLAEEGRVNAILRNLLNRLIALWTTHDRIHSRQPRPAAAVIQSSPVTGEDDQEG